MELQNVSKSFETVYALQKINLKIPYGKITTLLGPSGSGKTTLLRILAGLDKPTEGIIYYKNKQINAERKDFLRKKATLVFQKSIFFNTTVYNNVAFGLKIKKNISEEDCEKKVLETLNLVGLGSFADRRAKKLSGGEQQRVSLARALVLDRELLLLDEPTVNLDPKNVSVIEETIQRINQEKNTTIVLATHNMFQAEAISKNICLILDGTVKQTGSNEEIFGKINKYLNSFARIENIFSGISHVEGGISIIKINNKLKIEASFNQSGKVIVNVNPEDILISTHRIKSSARNVFNGKIVEIKDFGSVTKLIVDTGKKFSVQITKKSLKEMQLHMGSDVFLTFKASSVKLI